MKSLARSTWRRDARARGVPSEGRRSRLDTVRADAEVCFTEDERLAVHETWTQVISTCRWVSFAQLLAWRL